MRKDHRPYGLHRLQKKFEAYYAGHFITPQLDACGMGFETIGARWISVSGPSIAFGENVHLMALRDAPIRLAVFESMGKIKVGDHVLMNPGVRVVSAESIEIGPNCMLAMHCHLSDADWHDTHHRIFAPGKTRPIKLGNNVWLGDGVRVLKGVSIGDNTIVGAGSVVSKSLPKNVIAAGNPAVVISSLDQAEVTTRAALFTMDQSYDAFAETFMRARLAGNTWGRWLKAVLMPGLKD